MPNCIHKNLLILTINLILCGNIAYAYDFDQAALILEGQQQENTLQQEKNKIREYRLRQWQEQQRNIQQQKYQQENAQAAPDAEDLFDAAINGNVDQVRRLLAQGLDINISNRERETALHMAAARGHYSLVIYLVNNGAYVNAPTVKNWIPLHHAVRFRHPNIVNFLMKHGSSANSRTSDGLSAIDMAKNTNNYRLLSLLGAR